MDTLDFTKEAISKPSQSPVYDAAAAKTFFEVAGKAENVVAGTVFFEEHQRQGLLSPPSRMYLLLEGSVVLSLAGKSVDKLGAGEIFGEMATITGSTRSATATAKTGCRVIALDSRQFQKGIAKSPAFALMLMSIMIGRVRLTLARLAIKRAASETPVANDRRVFDDELLEQLSQEFGNPAPLKFTAGQTIISAHEPGVLMYLPREGRVAITADGRALEHVGPGGVFGEMALVDRGPRVADAVAETDCRLLAVNRAQFLELIQTKPDFGLSLLKNIGQRLQATTERTRV